MRLSAFELLGIVLAAIAFVAGSQQEARAAAPLYDPVVLNIGVNCHWQPQCQRLQHSAMKNAGRYVAHENPPLWRIQLCNKNARRGTARIDWVGFNNCIHNNSLGPLARRRR
jgi:hypothetical protein